MGKASKWFRGLLGLKKSSPIPPSQPSGLELPKQPKRRWNFVKSYKEREREREKYHKPLPPKTLYSNTSGLGTREEWAVVKIQSNFRAYLSRRALRALKALVKLQALVRGHIVRKQTADMLQCMQSLLRAQARARAGRAQISDTQHSITKSSLFYHGPATPEKLEQPIRAKSTKQNQWIMHKRNVSKSDGKVMVDVDHEKAILDCKRDEGSWTRRGCSIRTGPTDENRDKILEIEMGKPHVTPKRMIHSSHHRSASDHNSHSFTTSKDSTIHQTVPSPSYEVQSLSTVKLAPYDEETSFCTAENSPQFYSASSKGVSSMRGTFTPMSDGSRSYLSGYSDHPNYMASTASSKAKIRSLSAPRPRPQFEMSNTTKRYGQRVSELRATFTGKAYPGSGRMERLTMHASSFTGRDWRI